MNHKVIFLDIDGTLLPFNQDKALKPRWIRTHQRDCLTWANAEEALLILGVEIPWFN